MEGAPEWVLRRIDKSAVVGVGQRRVEAQFRKAQEEDELQRLEGVEKTMWARLEERCRAGERDVKVEHTPRSVPTGADPDVVYAHALAEIEQRDAEFKERMTASLLTTEDAFRSTRTYLTTLEQQLEAHNRALIAKAEEEASLAVLLNSTEEDFLCHKSRTF